MASEGKSPSEIAERINSTPGSVRVLASELGIRLRSRKDKESKHSARLFVAVPRSVSTKLSTLATRAGFSSASVLAGVYLEELVKGELVKGLGDVERLPLGGDPDQNAISIAASSITARTTGVRTITLAASEARRRCGQRAGVVFTGLYRSLPDFTGRVHGECASSTRCQEAPDFFADHSRTCSLVRLTRYSGFLFVAALPAEFRLVFVTQLGK